MFHEMLLALVGHPRTLLSMASGAVDDPRGD
jgi:hypothetical protein